MIVKLWEDFKNHAEVYGAIMLFLGTLALLVALFLTVLGIPASDTIGLMLGLFSVGLGSMSIDMSTKSDSKYTILLEQLSKSVIHLPTLFINDVLSPSGQKAVNMLSTESKDAAQKRLDDDTRKVGYARGELYQLPDGNWGIHWGGKYPL